MMWPQNLTINPTKSSYINSLPAFPPPLSYLWSLPRYIRHLIKEMTYWRLILRFLAAQQLLPALAATEQEALIGGQAVFEGVMMRSPHAWGIAVRKPMGPEPDTTGLGEIVVHSEPLQRPSDKHHWMAWPFVRGLVTLGQAIKLGFRASKFPVNI